ncbi:protein PERCC1 [Anolis carolinensis]|uniref:protein PERCC1 n=1 Tax=Anolis carolinensis TaxID=28377 RepID=UPI002F2B319E
MAAGVIQSLSKFRLSTAFQHSFLSPTACQELIFQDLSEEEDMEDEEEEEEEGEEEEEEREAVEEGSRSASCRRGEAFAASSSATEMTRQLLRFAERISNDIQSYFGSKGAEEGSCNIYEAGCSPKLSGRVLYYTDLVRLSQSRESEEDEGSPASPKERVQGDGKLGRSFCSQEEAEKLGPLAELFEYGLCGYVKQKVSSDNRKYGRVAPMHGRKLPASFWKEPSLSPLCMLHGNPPDFSDLLANWTSETCQEELHASQEHLAGANRLGMDHFGGL